MAKGGGIKPNKGEKAPDWLKMRPANDNAIPRAANDNARPLTSHERALADIEAAWQGAKGVPPPAPKRPRMWKK